MINPDRALDYLAFVVNRHRVWEKRQQNLPQPWTEDPILASRKFTSVFRVLDPGSQYVLTDLYQRDGEDPEDLLLRLFLYRHTGRTEVWDWLAYAGVGLPNRGNLEQVLEAWQDYRARTGKPLFTGAYLVYPQSHEKGTDKIYSIVYLAHRLFAVGDVASTFLAAESQAGRFSALRSNKGVADFMSMQVLTDWGYFAPEDREDDFVVLGPGARRGALALDPHSKPEATLEWAYTAIRSLPEPPTISLPDGRVRLPSRMDVQNTLCEFSKYVRFQSKPTPGKVYTPAHPGPQPAPALPERW